MDELLHIGRFDARYRLPRARRGERDRLDEVLARLLAESLERAARIAGLDNGEEVCVRRADVLLRLRLSAPEAVLADEWSRAIAVELRRLVDRMSDGGSAFGGAAGNDFLVRYRSRTEALVSLVLEASRGERSRAWAWRQLGLPSTGRDGELVARALAAEPERIVAVLAEVARRGGLPSLLRALRGSDWRPLVGRALSAAGAEPALVVAPPDGEPRPSTAMTRAQAEARAERIVAASSIARAASRAGRAAVAGEARRPLAALALLESEPARLRSGRAQAAALLDAIERALLAAAGTPRAEIDRILPIEQPPPPSTKDEARAALDEKRARPDDDRARAEDDRVAAARSVEGAATTATNPDAAREGTSIELRDRDAAIAKRTVEERVLDDEEPPLDGRLRGRTDFGGLPFLLHLVAELELVDEILAHPLLGERSLRWTLYHLARTLRPVGALDPAALAFAGIGPRARMPWELEPAPQPREQEPLDALAARIAARLVERMGRPERAPEELLASVCRRRAEVVADPGWIEVHLALDDVDVAVRRAGLDLHPGYLPWLGVVVRFVYGAA